MPKNFEKMRKKPSRPPQELAKKRKERQVLRAFLKKNSATLGDPKTTIKHVANSLENWTGEPSDEQR